MPKYEQAFMSQFETIKKMTNSEERKRHIDDLIQKYGHIECASAALEYNIDLAKEIIRQNKEVCFRSGGHVVSNCICSLCESEVHSWKIKSSYDGETFFICTRCGKELCENSWNEGELLELKFQ